MAMDFEVFKIEDGGKVTKHDINNLAEMNVPQNVQDWINWKKNQREKEMCAYLESPKPDDEHKAKEQ